MIRKVLAVVFIASVFTAMPVNAAGPGQLSVTDVAEELVCQCGCTMILSNCSHQECHSRETMTTFIAQEIDRGQTRTEIIQTFVRQYGEQVLASPPKKGFNLVVWITPFAAILAGAAVIYIVIKKWIWQGKLSASKISDDSSKKFDDYEPRLEKELKDFNGKGFR